MVLVMAASLVLAACGNVDQSFWPRTTPGIMTAAQAPSLRAGMGEPTATSAPVAVSTDGRSEVPSEPFLVIAAGETPEAYEPRLQAALSQARAANRDLRLEVVAVSPLRSAAGGGLLDAGSLRSDTETLLRRLQRLGFSGERVHLSARASAKVGARAIELYSR